mmetsp:Transcript_40763/g.113317  ORF Transcript_40763/g.113317 Transcript_40763/m.113317 type:complete len:781 (-) Transcript_40763:100-2442(-)
MGCCNSSANRGTAPINGSKRLLEEYSVGPTLGEGAFGVVYLCTKRSTGEEVAVKMVDKVETPVEAIKREAEMLRSMNHYNIVKFHQVFFERCFVCIVMDKYTGGDLVEGLQLHLKERGKISCYDIVHVSSQMGAAVQYLHDRYIVHRDIKGDNYLMDRKNITDPKCHIVLTDFGTAYSMKPGERLSAEVGTRIFWAPEFFNRNYGLKVDIWAMGIIMYGLLDGRFPFKDEHDIKKKEPRIPKRVHPDCQDYLKQMLCKDEEQRISAAAVMTHCWITGSTKKQVVDDNPGTDSTSSEGGHLRDHRPEDGPKPNLRQDCANDGVQERRRELMERLNNEHTRGRREGGTKKPEPSAHFLASWFTINDRNSGCTFRFEWWDEAKVEATGIAHVEGVSKPLQEGEMDRSPQIVGQMLKDHNIDISQFGVGEARTLHQLADEVQRGAARLMLDATEHKKLVRVVDVVLVRLFSAPKDGKLLVEAQEQFPDGRKRSLQRLPGTKKDPHENSVQVAQRMLQDVLQMTDCAVQFDFEDKEVFEEEMISPSFPGVRTVYRKEIVQGHVTCGDPAILGRVGLPAGNPWSSEDTKKTVKVFEWMTEKQAIAHKVKLKADCSEEVSGLVMAPIGLNEEDLRNYLVSNNVDVSRFGRNHAKTLKEFSTELIKGESSLMQDQSGEVIRNVDLVIMRIISPSGNDLLVQTEQTFSDGTKTKLDRLPGAKRRPDESQFLTARRILRRQLKIDENQVRLDHKNCKYFQEEKPSPGFPGIRTVYRKCLITAELLKTKTG